VQNILRPRQFDAVLYEWRTLSNDPDQYENWHQTQIPPSAPLGQNYSGLDDRDISEALESARKTNDPAKRVELYRTFQELFADRVPGLLLYYPVYTYGIDSRVRGVQVAPMLVPSDRFRNVAQWYLKTKRVLPGTPVEEPTRPPVVEPTTLAPTAAPPIAVPPTIAPPTLSPVAPPSASPPSLQCANQSAIISSPAMDGTLSGLAEIRGTASRPNMAYWKLEYRPDAATGYTQLYRSEVPITDTVLSLWSTKTVPNGVYWLQLSVVDNTGNFGMPCQVRVNIAN
jgi:hypothetical protein